MKILAILLMFLGILGIAYGGVRMAYRDSAVDAGPLHISVTKHRTLPIPPLVGVVALAGGIALLAVQRRREA